MKVQWWSCQMGKPKWSRKKIGVTRWYEVSSAMLRWKEAEPIRFHHLHFVPAEDSTAREQTVTARPSGIWRALPCHCVSCCAIVSSNSILWASSVSLFFFLIDKCLGVKWWGTEATAKVVRYVFAHRWLSREGSLLLLSKRGPLLVMLANTCAKMCFGTLPFFCMISCHALPMFKGLSLAAGKGRSFFAPPCPTQLCLCCACA